MKNEIGDLEIVGEAANRLSDHFKNLYTEIVGMRNILIHEYFGVDEKIVWGIIYRDIPELKIKVEQILDRI